MSISSQEFVNQTQTSVLHATKPMNSQETMTPSTHWLSTETPITQTINAQASMSAWTGTSMLISSVTPLSTRVLNSLAANRQASSVQVESSLSTNATASQAVLSSGTQSLSTLGTTLGAERQTKFLTSQGFDVQTLLPSTQVQGLELSETTSELGTMTISTAVYLSSPTTNVPANTQVSVSSTDLLVHTSTTISSDFTITQNTALSVISPSLSTYPPMLPSQVIMSSSPVTKNSTKVGIYIWACLCNPFNSSSSNLTTTEWSEWYSDTHGYDKHTTSKHRRSLISAEDDRTSAMSMGLVSVSFITAIGVLMIALDVIKVIFELGCTSGK